MLYLINCMLIKKNFHLKESNHFKNQKLIKNRNLTVRPLISPQIAILGASQVAQMVKKLPAMQETQF